MKSYTHYILIEMGRCMDSIFIAAIAVLAVISVAAVVLGLLRGRGAPRKKLLRSVLLLGGIALVCFGGEAALAQFDMGWRCVPYNTMLFLCGVLFLVTLWRSMKALSFPENTHSVVQMSVFASLVLLLFIALTWVALFFLMSSWHDFLAPYNGQTIVCATDQHGGSANWCYYTHINSIVHGGEIVPAGRHIGNPAFWS